MSSGPDGRVTLDLPALAVAVAAEYGLGPVASWQVLTTGYEDCNIDLQAAGGRVVVKVFPPRRGRLAARTAGIITAVQAAGARHPRIHPDQAGQLTRQHDGHSLIVMDFDPGQSVYDIRRPPDQPELAEILTQAILIHSAAINPGPVHDPWAITSLPALAATAARLAPARLQPLISQAITQAGSVDRAALPHVLAHGDLTKGNVLLRPGPQATIIDYAVAARLPRVQELAVIAANLTHGDSRPVPARAELIAGLYSGLAPVPLTEAEWTALRPFSLAATCMELLGALAEWHHGNHSPETEYLISLGTAGLEGYL